MLDDSTPISKSTGVKLTLGAVIGLTMFVVFVDRRFGALETQGLNHNTQVETLSRRQNTYIDRRNDQHDKISDDLNELNERLDRLCESLASRESAVICNE